jgi:hypothetical protein
MCCLFLLSKFIFLFVTTCILYIFDKNINLNNIIFYDFQIEYNIIYRMTTVSIPHLYVTGTNYEIGFKTVNMFWIFKIKF